MYGILTLLWAREHTWTSCAPRLTHVCRSTQLWLHTLAEGSHHLHGSLGTKREAQLFGNSPAIEQETTPAETGMDAPVCVSGSQQQPPASTWTGVHFHQGQEPACCADAVLHNALSFGGCNFLLLRKCIHVCYQATSALSVSAFCHFKIKQKG